VLLSASLGRLLVQSICGVGTTYERATPARKKQGVIAVSGQTEKNPYVRQLSMSSAQFFSTASLPNRRYRFTHASCRRRR
jgi:hypothetical protein